MAKVRVYELAKELGIESKVVMTKLTELGEFVVRYARMTLDDTQSFIDQLNKLRQGGHGP